MKISNEFDFLKATGRKICANHAISVISGFIHEHTRPDRMDYVTIHWDKINQSLTEDYLPSRFFTRMQRNFEICPNCTTFGQYDFNSIMHYPATMGMHNRTIITVNDGKCGNDCRIGQRQGLSDQDISDIYDHYQCRK